MSNKVKRCAMHVVAAGLAMAALGTAANDAEAALAYSIAGGPIAGNQSYTGALGNDFDVNSAIVIDSLGAFDDNADGIAGSIDVHIFNLSDTSAPLASVVVDSSTTTLDGQFRFVTLGTPLELGPGSYSVVAFGFDGTDQNGNEHTGDIPLVTDSGGGLISFVDSRFGAADPTVTFPASTTVLNFACSGAPEACFAAGSFTFDASPIPAPATLALFGFGLLGLSGLRRRR